MFRITCPHCQVALRADDRSLGRNVRCPKCKQILCIPVPVQLLSAAPAPKCLNEVDVEKVEGEPAPVAVGSPPEQRLLGTAVLNAVQGYGKPALAWIRRRKLLATALLTGLVLLMCLPVWRVTKRAILTDMSLAAYLAQRPHWPTWLNVECKLGNYYNYAYRYSAPTHYNVGLRANDPIKSAYAWVPKKSEVGERLFYILRDGRVHRLVLKVVLEGPYGEPTPPGREELAIVDIVE